MKHKTLLLASALLSLTATTTPSTATATVAATATAAERGQEIAAELTRRGAGYGDMSAALTMVLRNASGQESSRAMRIRTLEQPAADQGDRSLVVFDSPSDVKGTALLSHAGVEGPDDQWLFLPALGRTRRISSKNTSGPFMGSEFAYEDITGAETSKFTWELLSTDACGSLTCFKLETRPRYERSGYTKRVVWVDDAEYRVHKIDFYDRKGELLKTLTYGNYEKVDGKYWRSKVWSMKNVQSGKSTVLSFGDFRLGNGFTERDFSKAALANAR